VTPPAPGYRDDGGKPRPDLLPWDAVAGVAQVLTWACTARKPEPYPERNWEAGMKWSRVFNSAIRHAWSMWLAKLLGTSELDADSNLPHADHFATNALMLAAYCRRPALAAFDDRPTLDAPKGVADPLKDCASCGGKQGYHRTPCATFEVTLKSTGAPR